MKISETIPQKCLPYSKQHISENDIQAVVDVLRSDWLTQGPAVPVFESALAERVRALEVVACSSGTAALHLAMLTLGIGPGDEIVTSPITFLATANCARFVGAEVRFADVNPDTGLIDTVSLERVLQQDTQHKIKAVLPVHLAGQPADMVRIHELARAHDAHIVDDACHALGGVYLHNNEKYFLGGGPHTDMTVFSFHPVKHVAMGEGGALTTDNPELAKRLRLFRNHGMQKESLSDHKLAYASDGSINPWYYEMHSVGYNYRLTDIQAALGASQLGNLDKSLQRRNQLADLYTELICESFPDRRVTPLTANASVFHAYHLFVVLIDFNGIGITRAEVMRNLRAAGIGTQVHYIPIYLQPYYAERYDINRSDFPGAEKYYNRALSLPLFPGLSEGDVKRVVHQLDEILSSHKSFVTL